MTCKFKKRNNWRDYCASCNWWTRLEMCLLDKKTFDERWNGCRK